jgi:hypothetical protein
VTTSLRLDRTKEVGCAATLVLVVPPGLSSGSGRRGGTHIGVQRDRLFIQTDHRFLRVIRPFVNLQNILHFGDVIFVEFGHSPHFFPATA